jgi:DNA-binding transcriptional LysR family regulator
MDMNQPSKTTLNIYECYQRFSSIEAWLSAIALYQTGDLGLAAKAMKLSQPALSFHLNKLEQELDLKLFQKSGKRKIFTPVGQQLIHTAQKYFIELFEVTHQSLFSLQDSTQQQIKIAGRRELLLPLLSAPIVNPVKWIQCSSEEAIQKLKRGEVHFAISSRLSQDLQKSTEIISKVLYESGVQLIFPTCWPAHKPTHGSKNWKLIPSEEKEFLENLFKKPVVSYGDHAAYLLDFLKFHQKNLADITILNSVEDWFSVVELVKQKKGWAIIPSSWNIHDPSVKAIEISHQVVPLQKVYVFYSKTYRTMPWVKELLNFKKL